jgi:hypothetical protein
MLFPDHFTLKKRVPLNNWIGGCVGPKAYLDAEEKIFKLNDTRYPTPRKSSLLLVAVPTALFRLLATIPTTPISVFG